jgi:hypothetical protein
VVRYSDLDECVYEGLRAGASRFLLKDVLAADLAAAVLNQFVTILKTRYCTTRFTPCGRLPAEVRQHGEVDKTLFGEWSDR